MRSVTLLLWAFTTSLWLHMPSSLSAQENTERSAERITPQDIPPANCRVTLPSDGVYEPSSPKFGPSRTPFHFYFGTDKLWTVLPADGTWRGPYPGAPPDFVYYNKLAWHRNSQKSGPLIVSGRRLDGPAPSFIQTNEFFAYNAGGIIDGVRVPAYGCWEITGQYDDQVLTFTVWVTSLSTREPASHASSPEILTEQPARAEVIPRVHVNGETAARSLYYKVLPETPRAARATNTYGTVVLQAVIGTDGRAHHLSYISGPQPLVRAAMDAVGWYRYRIPVIPVEPGEEEDMEVDTTVAVLFPAPSD
jgi:hypothetical protein